MNKLNLVGVFFVTILLLVSCNQNSKSADNTKIVTNEIDSSNSGNDFESFQANFEPLALDNLKELGEQFNNHYLANDNSLIEVSQIYKERYLDRKSTRLNSSH